MSREEKKLDWVISITTPHTSNKLIQCMVMVVFVMAHLPFPEATMNNEFLLRMGGKGDNIHAFYQISEMLLYAKRLKHITTRQNVMNEVERKKKTNILCLAMD